MFESPPMLSFLRPGLRSILVVVSVEVRRTGLRTTGTTVSGMLLLLQAEHELENAEGCSVFKDAGVEDGSEGCWGIFPLYLPFFHLYGTRNSTPVAPVSHVQQSE